MLIAVLWWFLTSQYNKCYVTDAFFIDLHWKNSNKIQNNRSMTNPVIDKVCYEYILLYNLNIWRAFSFLGILI